MASIIIWVPLRGSSSSSRALRSAVRIRRSEIEVAPPNSDSRRRSQFSRVKESIPVAIRARRINGAIAALEEIASRSPTTGIDDCPKARRIAVAVVLCARTIIAISE